MPPTVGTAAGQARQLPEAKNQVPVNMLHMVITTRPVELYAPATQKLFAEPKPVDVVVASAMLGGVPQGVQSTAPLQAPPVAALQVFMPPLPAYPVFSQ